MGRIRAPDPDSKPSCPVSATVNTHPDPTVPNSVCGTISVAVWLGSSGTRTALPIDFPDAPTQTGAAKPWASSRSLHPGAIV